MFAGIIYVRGDEAEDVGQTDEEQHPLRHSLTRLRAVQVQVEQHERKRLILFSNFKQFHYLVILIFMMSQKNSKT